MGKQTYCNNVSDILEKKNSFDWLIEYEREGKKSVTTRVPPAHSEEKQMK